MHLSAQGLIDLLEHEAYREEAYYPVKGDVLTIGFGRTEDVKPGEKTNPIKELKWTMQRINKIEATLFKHVVCYLKQNQIDALVSLIYNIGESSFIKSTLLKRMNVQDPNCWEEILRWDKFKGKPLVGLTKRRRMEYEKCLK